MKYGIAAITLTFYSLFIGCSKAKLEKGFPVSSGNDKTERLNGFNNDSLVFETRPSSVLLTGHPNVRLTTIYKVNFDKDDNTSFIGSNNFHYLYGESEDRFVINWNHHLIPGLEAAYGYNMVNVSLFDIKENVQKSFFDKPVLIKTLYYPSFT